MPSTTNNKKPLVIAITPPNTYGNEHETIAYLLNNGVDLVHVRKPAMLDVDMECYLKQFDWATRDNLSLHGQMDTAEQMGLGGTHTKDHIYLTNNTLKRVSKSCHSINEVANCPTSYHYVFLSPVFDSISKKGYLSTLNHSEIRQFLQDRTLRTTKVVALGGIDASNAATTMQLGFDGFALLGSLWHIDGNIINTNKTLQNLKNTIAPWNNPLY